MPTIVVKTKAKANIFAKASEQETIRRVRQLADELTGGNLPHEYGRDNTWLHLAFADEWPWPGKAALDAVETKRSKVPPPRYAQPGIAFSKAEAKAEKRNSGLRRALDLEVESLRKSREDHKEQVYGMFKTAAPFLSVWMLDQLAEGVDPFSPAKDVTRNYTQAWIKGWRPKKK